jgi:hypothetical protein
MIGGFILQGGASGAQVLIRAIGPTLTQAGVSGALSDPTLELHDANGALVSTNDNWKDSQEAETDATGLLLQADAESTILAEISLGNHTTIVPAKTVRPVSDWSRCTRCSNLCSNCTSGGMAAFVSHSYSAGARSESEIYTDRVSIA